MNQNNMGEKEKNKIWLHVHRGPIKKLRPKEMTNAGSFYAF